MARSVTMSLDAKIQSIFVSVGRDLVAAIRASISDEVRRLHYGRGVRNSAPKVKSSVGRRSSKQIAAVVGKLLAFIRQHPGVRSEQIMRKLGGDKALIKDALRRLRATKKVRTVGIKRAMAYRAA
jgi:hypothetical protein